MNSDARASEASSWAVVACLNRISRNWGENLCGVVRTWELKKFHKEST